MLKKSIAAVLISALILTLTDYNAYAEEIVIEYEEAEPGFEAEELELEADGGIQSFGINNINNDNTLKLWQRAVPSYSVTTSSPESVIYPDGCIDDASANDVIVRLESSDVRVIDINHDNNSIYALSCGGATLTATAYLKKDKDSGDDSLFFTSNVELTVLFPTGEIMDDGEGRKVISFDGINEYSGWVAPLGDGKYEKADAMVSGGSYFIGEGDLVDTGISQTAGALALDCAVWIDGNLYKFDENGVVLKNDVWHRLKDISLSKDETVLTDPVMITEGEAIRIDIDYVPEQVDAAWPDDMAVNINDDKRIHATSSNPAKIKIGSTNYEYDYDHNGDKSIKRCSLELIALSVTENVCEDVTITIVTGDEDNKYREGNLTKTVNVRSKRAKGFKVVSQNTYFVKDDGEYAEGWYPDEEHPEYYFYTGDDESAGRGRKYSMAVNDLVEIPVDASHTCFYTFDSEGHLIGKSEGWKNSAAGRKYFCDGNAVIGTKEIDGNIYLFDDAPECLLLKNGVYEVNGSKYLVNKNGIVMTGWQKVKTDGAVKWRYFSNVPGADFGKEIIPSDPFDPIDPIGQVGKSYCLSIVENGVTVNYFFPNGGTPYVYKLNGKKVVKSDVTVKDSDDKVYYINNKGIMEKGWKKITEGGVSVWHYFSLTDGAEADEADITVTDDADGKSKWRTVEGMTFFFISDKTLAKGFRNGYYFDENGVQRSGIITYKNKKYLVNTNDFKLLKNYYGPMQTEKYLTDKSGVLKSGWQKVKVGDVTAWHYFSTDDFAERAYTGADVKVAADGKSVWRTVDGRTYFFPSDKSVAKGFKDIKDEAGVKHTYYFDKVTGELLSGKITIGRNNYFLNSDGEKLTSQFVKVNGNYIYLNKSGVASTKWFTINGNKYYGDPLSGNIYIGFNKIGKNMYYFSETGVSIGQMQTGFITVPDLGQDYFDQNGSNIYYADAKGLIVSKGWKSIKADNKAKDAQIWSYYFDPKNGEVVTGEAVIDDDGTVYKYVPGNTDISGDINKMYSFDEKTGARKRAVLYFHGGAYSESLLSADHLGQFNTMMSLAGYINSDRSISSPSDMMIFAGYTNLAKSSIGIDMTGSACFSGITYDASVTNGTAGFPIAACKNVASERDSYNAVYDVASYDRAEDTYNIPGAGHGDGAVDIGDIEVFSFDLYCKVMDRFGPKNVVLMGASSGGAIALSVLAKANDLNIALPSKTILYSPWVDASMSNPKAKRYSSRGVDYPTLLYKGARVTRDASYNNGNPYGADDAKGPGALSAAAWFASPALVSNGCNFDGIRNVTIYAGTNDPCYPDVADFAARHKKTVTLKKATASHCYMFDNGAKVLNETAKAVMTE